MSPNHPRFYGIWVNVHHPNYPSRLYIQDDLRVSLNNKRLLVEGESHIQPTGVQTPDTERVSAHKSTGGGKGRGEKGEGPRTAETWFVSRHYEPRTEV